MKKYAKIITLLLLACLLSLTLCACIYGDNDTSGNMTLVILPLEGEAEEFSVNLSKLPSGNDAQSGLMAVLEYLQNNGKLTYTAQSSQYGSYLTQVGNLVADDAKHTFIALYTDVESDMDLSDAPFTITYKDKTYTASGVGASGMSAKENCTIIITLGTY
ncbi:MAG: hypothetical protein HFE33_03120 [Clostridia bacterium]|jgi:hypothetical protein|nr:hypothetical protein [Clostridia bacterium]